VDSAVANENEIASELRRTTLPALIEEFPGLTWTLVGQQQEQEETLGGLWKGAVIALMLIYTLLALAFGSFVQPVIVMLAIPFGMVGAVLGHWLLGHDLTLLSTVGLLAMAGVVVNDSMIMIDFVNRARARGASPLDAIRESGPRRFRPILLTSLTTFAGVTPLLLETSVQAQFLIPMAISLSFGVMFSTFVILLVVPAAYLILDDVARFLSRLVRVTEAPSVSGAVE
jgi:multidrug efflux pump subunit AcrB